MHILSVKRLCAVLQCYVNIAERLQSCASLCKVCLAEALYETFKYLSNAYYVRKTVDLRSDFIRADSSSTSALSLCTTSSMCVCPSLDRFHV
jgi:hypothetical protein